MKKRSWVDEVKFDPAGLVPAIVQDAATGEVLMMAFMNQASLLKTLKTGKTHFYSRSRKRMWLKGESSGHVQRVKRIALDCDGDTVLITATQVGGACHTGHRSCFFRTLGKGARWMEKGRKVFDPRKVYGG